MDDYPAADDIPDPAVEFQFQELTQFLTNNPEMRTTAKQSIQQGLYAGGGAVVGGMLLGPVGGLVGGVMGSLVGFWTADDYDGAVQQILLVRGSRKERLVQEVHRVLLQAGATARQFENAQAFRSALVNFASQRAVRDQVWKACLESIRD